MAKAALLLPHAELVETLTPLLQEYHSITIMTVEHIQTDQAVARAKELESQGCDLIIARGLQARMIKRHTPIPVVEIRASTQELGMLMLDIKHKLGIPTPRIGLICFANMVGDTSSFEQLFQLELKTYFAHNSEELRDAVDVAKQDGCHAVIGGDIVRSRAEALGMKYGFFPSGEESLRDTLTTAARIGYAIDQEKLNSAEMDTMLNYTFSGIMQIDSSGSIRRINRTGYDLLEQQPKDLLGKKVTDVIPNLSQKLLDDALIDAKESYAFLLDIRHKAVVVNIAPIQTGSEIQGAILTFQEDKRIIEMDGELRRELCQRGYIAKHSFDKLICNSKASIALVKTAKRIAKYDAPILLTGEPGSGKDILAQCIHKESLFRNNAFIPVDCSAWMPETLDSMLFGNYTTRKDAPSCIAELAQGGTLYLSHVEALMLESQYKLLNLIRGKFMHNGSNTARSTKVRVIVSSDSNLITYVEKGKFRGDLYYALSVLSLELLPLRQRREDILDWAEFYLNEWQEKYKRYVHLTQGARQFLKEYDWPGNLNQMNSICERIVLLTEKRNIDEVFLKKQLDLVAPQLMQNCEKVVLFKDQKAVEITQLLRKYGGNREKVSQALGVSKTTLWRYMKKYGIEADFSY